VIVPDECGYLEGAGSCQTVDRTSASLLPQDDTEFSQAPQMPGGGWLGDSHCMCEFFLAGTGAIHNRQQQLPWSVQGKDGQNVFLPFSEKGRRIEELVEAPPRRGNRAISLQPVYVILDVAHGKPELSAQLPEMRSRVGGDVSKDPMACRLGRAYGFTVGRSGEFSAITVRPLHECTRHHVKPKVQYCKFSPQVV